MSSFRIGVLALGALSCASEPPVHAPMTAGSVAAPASSPAPSEAFVAPPPAPPSSPIDPLLEYGRPPDPACVGATLTFGSLSPCKCSGNHEPAGVLRAGLHCAPAFYRRDLTGLLETQVAVPSRRVPSGAMTTVEVILQNVGLEQLPIIVNAFPVRDVLVIDRRGRDVSIDGNCGQGFGPFGTDYLITLEPRGQASFAVRWSAVSRNLCNGVQTPLPKGRYQLRVLLGHVFDLPSAQDVREATIDVD